MRWKMKVLCGLLVVASSTGCATFTPADPQVASPGEFVRLTLTRDGMERIRGTDEPSLQSLERPLLQGVLVHREEDRLSMRVPVTVQERGFLKATLSQQLTLPMTEIVALERRKLSQTRTALAVLGAAGIGAVVLHLILGEAIHPTGRETTYPQDARLPAPGGP